MKTTFLVLFLFLLFDVNALSQDLTGVAQTLDSLEKSLNFNGVVLISKGNDILLQKGYGYLDRKKKTRTDKNTVYNIASIAKSFTAIAIVKLVQEGQIKLQDSVGKFFKDAPLQQSQITIHQLLTHQSGIPQTYAAEGATSSIEAAQKIWNIKTVMKPGEKFIYGNDNYTLLGIIIEKVTSKKWKDYLKEIILTPLGMTHTYFWGEQNITGLPVAVPAKKIKQLQNDYGFIGANGIFSTAGNLLKFQNVFKTNLVLTDASKGLLTGNYVKLTSPPSDNTDYYSYGLFHTVGEKNSIWVRGSEDEWGVSIAYWFPKKDLSVIVLSNLEQLSNGEKQHIYTSQEIIKRLY